MAKVYSIYKRLLGYLLVLLGFGACDKEILDGNDSNPHDVYVMYGAPYAEYIVKGQVKSQSGQTLKGIQVIAKVVNKDGRQIINELRGTTDSKGNYNISGQGNKTNDAVVNVYFEDIDGKDNGGEFAKDSVMNNSFKYKDVNDKTQIWKVGEFNAMVGKTLKQK